MIIIKNQMQLIKTITLSKHHKNKRNTLTATTLTLSFLLALAVFIVIYSTSLIKDGVNVYVCTLSINDMGYVDLTFF